MLKISGYTDVYGIIGNPVRHSLSPAMYNYSFNELGINSVYLAFEIEKDKVGDYINAVRTLGIKGGNVTMPFKNAVIPFLDQVSKEAKLLGAVNTIVNKGGVLEGHNTDGGGMIAAIKAGGGKVKGHVISLYGGGGAASAILVAAVIEGALAVHVFTPNGAFEPAIENAVTHLKALHPNCEISINNLSAENIKKYAEQSSILINATPLGMAPDYIENSPVEDASVFRKDQLVVDAVYNPRNTRFLKEATAVGCKTIGGIGMLLWQGVESFRLFTGGAVFPWEKVKKFVLDKEE